MGQVRIRVKGQIGQRWSEWLDGLAITHTGEDETLLTGSLPDQPALYGLLSKLRDLGLVLLSVEVREHVGPASNGCPDGHGMLPWAATGR